MHLTIVAPGSRGDVQPVVALGQGLSRHGHRVRIASYDAFEDLVRGNGMEFARIEGDPRQALADQAGQQWQESGRSWLRFSQGMRRLATYHELEKSLADTVTACAGSEAILYTALGAAGYHVAEKLGVRTIYLLLQPMTRSRAEPCLFMPALPLGGAYNWWTYRVVERMIWQTVRPTYNRWRSEVLDLPAVAPSGPFDRLYAEREPFVYGFSPRVVPPAPDWPAWHHATGYWFLDREADWMPPPELAAFVESGPPPVSIGFGSMSGATARRLISLSVEAVQRTGLRAVLLGGWAAAAREGMPESILVLDSVPHDWLFPRMAAVVHHGGAGTTAAGLRAGKPTVAVPFMGDQPYWGRRVHALGVGPKPIQRSQLTVRRLADALAQAVSDTAIRQRAAALGEALGREDGVDTAVRIISKCLDAGRDAMQSPSGVG
jgi:UDP:flavonoid glycosyltransferase YjiC (YdhE family)